MDVERFRKVCGLLGSEHDGERAAAAVKATEMLKAAGKSWGQVGLQNGVVAREAAVGAGEAAAYRSTAELYRKLLDDERARNSRLDGMITKLKAELNKLQQRAAGSVKERADGTLVDADTGQVFGKRKLSKGERKEYYRAQHYERLRQKQQAEREANPRTVEPGDEQRRQEMREALEGELMERTQVFFTSVLKQEAWTQKQREAVEKTLRWVYAGRN